MKQKIIISISIVISFIIISCSRPSHIAKEVNYYGYDFRKYSSQNFLFTPEKYIGEYESVGLLEVEIFPEIFTAKDDNDETYYPWEKAFGTYHARNISPQEILDSLFVLSKDMGANAVMNFQIIKATKNFHNLIIEGIRANGFAIKRK